MTSTAVGTSTGAGTSTRAGSGTTEIGTGAGAGSDGAERDLVPEPRAGEPDGGAVLPAPALLLAASAPPLAASPVPLAEPDAPALAEALVEPLAEAWLSYCDEQGVPRRVELTDGPPRLTLGRSHGVDVALPWDGQVSRLHAVLEHIGGQWTVEDDGLSRNGTFVNETRVAGRARLRDRDRLRLGRTVLTFCSPGPGADPRTIVGDAIPARRRLTPAQRAVLVALCRPCVEGRPQAVPATNAQIAAELFLSVEAVKTHLRGLFHTFGIESLPQNAKRARLVELAVAFGLAADDGER